MNYFSYFCVQKDTDMLSRKTRYAIIALSALSREYGKAPVPMSRIAKERHVPLRFLEGIFLQLRNEGILTSDRGISGGYRLSRPPEEIRILDIIMALHEDIQMISCVDLCGESYSCEFGLDREHCRIRTLFGEVHQQIFDTLSSRTLAVFTR